MNQNELNALEGWAKEKGYKGFIVRRLIIEVRRLREWTVLIRDIAIDYDGYDETDSLKKLIDELRGFAQDSLDGKSVEWEKG